MKHLRLSLALLALFTLIGGGSLFAQTNIIAGWDGGDDTTSPSNFGWTSSKNKTFNERNAGGGMRMTTTYSGYKLEDGTSYTYSASSDPSSVIFWVRYNDSGESFTYTFHGLEPNHYYEFSGLVGWHNNSNAPTFTVKINDGTNDLATMSKYVSTKTTLYGINSRFQTPSTITNTTDIKIVFTCNQTGDCMEAISALKLVEVVVKDELQAALTYANRVNTGLSNSTLASAITTAQGVYDDASATQAQVNEAASILNTAVVTALGDAAPADMTFVINNPGFESSEAISANQATGTAIDYSTTGWTPLSTSTSNSCGAVVSYDSDYTLNNVKAPSADNNNASGNALGISIGWSATVAYQSSAITLPAGTYTITVYGYNNNSNGSNFTSKNGFITSSNNYLSTKTSFTNGTWETDVITFSLTEPTTGVFQIGGTAGNNTSNSHAKVFFDNITLAYENPLAGAKTAWVDAVAAAKDAITKNPGVTGDELTALNEELAKAEPTTVEGYNEATTALTTATNTLIEAAPSYSAFTTAATAEYGILTYAATAKRTALDEACNVTPTSAADADAKTAAIVTALRAYYESHALAEKVEDALDMTSRIANPNAEDGNNGWTWNGPKNNPANSEPWTDADGNSTHNYFDGGNWSASSWTTTMKQTISLPAGKFLLTAKGRAATNTTLTMSVGEVSISLPNVGNVDNVFDRGWGDASVEFETDGSDIEILVKASSETIHEWFSISDFRLVRLELYTEMATTEDYEAMAAALVAANAMTLGFDEGEYAPYNNVKAIEAIAAAEAIDTESENAKADIEAITSALGNWTANTEEVNAIYDGTLANAPIQATNENVVLPGWVTKSGNTRQTFQGTGENGKACLSDAIDGVGLFVHPGEYVYGETAGYTMPLKAGVLYQAEAKYCAWADGSNNDFSLTIKKGDSNIASKAFGANGTACTESGALKSVKLYFTPSEDGNYVLSVGVNGNTFMTDFFVKKAVAVDLALNEGETYTPVTEETYANVTMTRKVVAGYNTVCLPFDLTADQVSAAFGAGTEIYAYSDQKDDEGDVQINFNKGDGSITANVPVLVKATAASNSQTFEGVQIVASDGAVVEGDYFDFVGTYAPTPVAAGDYFIGNGALYKSENNTSMKAFRAYIHAKAQIPGAKVTLFIDNIATSISEINGIEAEPGVMYNIAGQRVNKAQKGIYIVNGKKVLVK